MASKKDFKALIKMAEDRDWTVVPTRGNHLRWQHKNGGPVVFSAQTPSDHRALENHLRELRKAGLVLKPKG